MTTTERTAAGPDRPVTVRAVLALLASPAAWLVSLGLSYAVEDFTCAAFASAGAPAPAGSVRGVLLGLNVLMLALTVAAGVVSWRVLRTEQAHRSALVRFLGQGGVSFAAVFALGVVLIGMNPLLLEVCA